MRLSSNCALTTSPTVQPQQLQASWQLMFMKRGFLATAAVKGAVNRDGMT